MDIEDEEDEGERKKEEELDSPLLLPAPRDMLQSSRGSPGALGTLGDCVLPYGGLEADSDAFSLDWALPDMEFTSLAFGKRTISFVCKSFSQPMPKHTPTDLPMKPLANRKVDDLRDYLKRGRPSRKPKLDRKYILTLFKQERSERTIWGIKLMRNGCFCGVVLKRASGGDFDRLMRAIGMGYVVQGRVVSTSMSKDARSRRGIVVGSVIYKIRGEEGPRDLDSE